MRAALDLVVPSALHKRVRLQQLERQGILQTDYLRTCSSHPESHCSGQPTWLPLRGGGAAVRSPLALLSSCPRLAGARPDQGGPSPHPLVSKTSSCQDVAAWRCHGGSGVGGKWQVAKLRLGARLNERLQQRGGSERSPGSSEKWTVSIYISPAFRRKQAVIG